MEFQKDNGQEQEFRISIGDTSNEAFNLLNSDDQGGWNFGSCNGNNASLDFGLEWSHDPMINNLLEFLPDMKRIAASKLGYGHPDLEDVVQDVALKVLELTASGSLYEEKQKGLMSTLARKRAVDYLRGTAATRMTEYTLDDPNAFFHHSTSEMPKLEQIAQNELYEAVVGLFDTAYSRNWLAPTILRNIYIDGMTQEQAAKESGALLWSLKTTVKIFLRDLPEKLNQLWFPDDLYIKK